MTFSWQKSEKSLPHSCILWWPFGRFFHELDAYAVLKIPHQKGFFWDVSHLKMVRISVILAIICSSCMMCQKVVQTSKNFEVSSPILSHSQGVLTVFITSWSVICRCLQHRNARDNCCSHFCSSHRSTTCWIWWPLQPKK